tara:strand:+ start:2475 stop:2810 length:336 start_codon:yes stop_codon:yes gene_type:complete
VDIIKQVQEHLPEGGKISFPKKGCHPRHLMSKAKILAQDVEITFQRLNLRPAADLAKEYDLTHPGVEKIAKRTTQLMREALDKPDPSFPKNLLDKTKTKSQDKNTDTNKVG